jgi:hypothetical protein
MRHLVFRVSRSITITGSEQQFSRVVHAPLELMLDIKEHRLLAILFQEPVRWTKKQEQMDFNRYVSLNKCRRSVCRVAYLG